MKWISIKPFTLTQLLPFSLLKVSPLVFISLLISGSFVNASPLCLQLLSEQKVIGTHSLLSEENQISVKRNSFIPTNTINPWLAESINLKALFSRIPGRAQDYGLEIDEAHFSRTKRRETKVIAGITIAKTTSYSSAYQWVSNFKKIKSERWKTLLARGILKKKHVSYTLEKEFISGENLKALALFLVESGMHKAEVHEETGTSYIVLEGSSSSFSGYTHLVWRADKEKAYFVTEGSPLFKVEGEKNLYDPWTWKNSKVTSLKLKASDPNLLLFLDFNFTENGSDRLIGARTQGFASSYGTLTVPRDPLVNADAYDTYYEPYRNPHEHNIVRASRSISGDEIVAYTVEGQYKIRIKVLYDAGLGREVYPEAIVYDLRTPSRKEIGRVDLERQTEQPLIGD